MTRIGHIGSMRHRVEIEQPEDVPDGAGGFARSWQPVITCWASATPMTGAEQGTDEQVQDRQAMRFVIRWQPGISADMRVVYDGRPFEIESISDPNQRKAYLVVEAREERP